MDCRLLGAYSTDQAAVGSPGSEPCEMEDGCREYQSSLEDLTFNSKPHINMLTILAEENLTYAKDIVAIIEAQISKAPSSEKLPVLYLVDSIVKNVGGEYLAVFAKNLITSFICVFEKVDENTRKSLFKLRSTWDEVFPLKKLYALDVRVNAIDPAWPIKPLPPTVNASIHVNPKFLKQSDEASSPQPVPSKPSTPPPPAAPVSPKPAPVAAPTLAPSSAPAPAPSSLTQEQMIRQQLLAKQKQLLELQQKKIELELEQTKAQLAGGFVLPASNPIPTPTPAHVPAPVPALVQPPVSAPAPVTTPASLSTVQRPVTQAAPVVRPRIPHPTQAESKPSTRDPRLNRPGPSQSKEQHAGKKVNPTTGSPAHTPEKNRPDKSRTGRRDVPEEKPKSKSKSPSPLAKSVHSKNKPAEAEIQKSTDGSKKDPRLKKRPQEKMGDEEQKEKKRCSEKRNDEASRSKGKLVNGSVGKHDRDDTSDKQEFKAGGNARTHARKRTRSRSRSRSPATNSSPKRKDRRSPKSRTRSSSPSPTPSHKAGKTRRVRAEEPEHSKDRPPAKKSQSESRRSKRPVEERDSPRGHDGGKEAKETAHRWRSGWEENKHPKLPEDTHLKPGAQRHKQYGTPTRPPMPRTPKHRLSVDANMQIPEVLNSASKKDLLRRASKRLESGEISQDDFLNMAHQIKHFFQYQEEKLQHSENWTDAANFPAKKTPAPTPITQARPLDTMDPAELSYYEHMSKLRKTQVTHRAPGDEWEGEESPEDGEGTGSSEKTGRHSPPHKHSRAPRDRPGERHSKEREEARPLGPMIEYNHGKYNHGKEFPTLKALPGLRFRRRADPREPSEREWTSPLTERQRDEQKSGYDAPRRYGPPDSRHPDPRRPEGAPPPSGTVVHRKCPSPTALDSSTTRFEREPLSPLHQKEGADQSPAPRFESPTSEHSDDGPLNLEASHSIPPPKSILKAAGRPGPLSSVRPHSDSPGHTPPHDGGHLPSRYERPSGPSRPHPQGWYEGGGPGRYDDPSRFDGPHPSGPGRFDGPPHHNMERFEGPHISHGPMRGGDTMGRFDGPPHCQDPGRFDGHMGQQPVRFEGQGPMHFNNMAPGPGFQPQRAMRFDGPPAQMGHPRFDGPGPMRFDGPGQGPPFDMPNVPHQGPPHYDCPPGQRFGPQHNLQPPMRPMAAPLFDSPLAPQQNFNMAPQRFQEPLNPPFPAGPMGGGLGFPQQNLQTAANFSMQPAPPFSQPGTTTFFNPTAPTVGLQPPVNMFLPQNPQLFGSTPAPPVVPPENHFGQVDVNDLLTKLINTGIIKPSQPDTTATSSAEATPAPAAPPAAVEEEEEEEQEAEEEEDLPDLTSFSIDDMKQRYESVVTKLYSGNQCCLCSMRFTAAQTDMYADHLDWHFRQNHAGKVASKKITHRRWYYSLTDWIEFEEIADLEERAKSLFFEKESEEEVQKNQAAAKEKEFQSVRAAKDQVGELCEICQEPFETYWVEEEEDWFLKNAIRVDDKNFHPSCFEDYKNSSYIDVTPSPNKLLSEHPLEAFIKNEEQEQQQKEEEEEEQASCCPSSSSIKQEVKTEVEELPVMKEEEQQEVLLEEVQAEQEVKL